MTTLQEWMKANGHDDVSFGKLVDRDRSLIYRLRNGTNKPSLELAAKIERETSGAVRMQTWANAA